MGKNIFLKSTNNPNFPFDPPHKDPNLEVDPYRKSASSHIKEKSNLNSPIANLSKSKNPSLKV